jgi:ABC-type dipeptide/oligopeptide/nickel transport system permease component
MFEFIAIVGAVQITIALLLWLFGYPSLFATYLAGFRNQEPKKWYDHFFNVFFLIFISVPYYSFLKIAKKMDFLKPNSIMGSV